MHSHLPKIISEMASDMPVLGSVRNKPTWRYTHSPQPLGQGMPLGTVVMVEATSSTPTANKEWSTGHQKWMAEMQSQFDNIMTMTWNTMECINWLDTCIWHQHEEYCQELKNLQADMRKAKTDLEHITLELKTHKTRILQMEQWHQPGKKIIEALEELQNWSVECGCEICKTPEKIHLRLENEWSRFIFLAERMDWMTWSTLKKFVERIINENFQQSPKPKRKRARHAADENDTGRHEVQEDNDNMEKWMTINVTNTDETETDYEDYSYLDPILPLEGSPRLTKDDKIMKIPGLEDLDWAGAGNANWQHQTGE